VIASAGGHVICRVFSYRFSSSTCLTHATQLDGAMPAYFFFRA